MRSAGRAVPARPCPECGTEDWWTRRRFFWPSLGQWLQGGGRWRTVESVCRRCGHRSGGSVTWLMVWPRPWWSLPRRLPRALFRALAGQRTATPAPWIYLAAAGLGGVAGALGGRRRRPLLVPAGMLAGAAAAWAGFTTTAVRRPGTWDELLDAALLEVAPRRARERQRRREIERLRSTDLPLYGLDATWTGSRWLGGSGWESSAQQRGKAAVTSVSLGHGDPRHVGPRVDVQVTRRYAPVGFRTLGDGSRHPAWQERELTLDGRRLSVRWRGHGGSWIARADLAQAQLVVRGDLLSVESIALVRITDLTPYVSRPPIF